MSDLADRLTKLDTAMAGVIRHPGDDQHEPFDVAPLPIFQPRAMMPPGMVQEEAEQAGLPHADFARIYREAWISTLQQVCEVTLVPNDEYADLIAARDAREPRRNQVMEFHTTCGQVVRAMARGFDTGSVDIPCALVNHQCGERQ